MEGSGLSGDPRFVRGVPVRVVPNRTDTSWAEEYTVTAAAPLESCLARPVGIQGPWTTIGRIVTDRQHFGRWLVQIEPVIAPAPPEVGESFDDSVGRLADAWRESSNRGAEEPRNVHG